MLGANEDTHPAIYLSKHGLSDVQKQCVEMEASGEYTRKQMAEKFGVHRNTIRRWLEQPSSKKYLETLQNEHRQQALSQINTAVPIATKKLVELINDSDKRVALEAVKAVLDRALGKPTTKVEIETEVQNTLEINIDDEVRRIMSGDTEIPAELIEAEFTDISE